MIGRILGNYKVEEKLGEGGMGAVYRGVDTMLDREVAIKALRPELVSQASVVERFRSEAVTLAKLNHPNIAALYTMFRQGAELYMVLEFVRGETLDAIIQRRGAMPAAEVIPVFCQILDGIDHAHELGIVHRDIKPANMMLTENGKLKVLDFGIARLLGSARMTRAGNIIGTLEYMAPEQVKGQETDGRSDIYALGMMLYEILTGRLPFDTDNEYELMKAQTEFMPTPPREINPNIPVEVEAAIMQAIQKNPGERFQTAGDFRETLIDAGFKAHGKMRRSSTGGHQSAPAPQISPLPISRTENANIVPEATLTFPVKEAAAANKEVKETRLKAAEAPFFLPTTVSVKETKLSDESGEVVASPYFADVKQPPSFFDKLNWIHYAGASFVGVMLLGLLLIVSIYVLRSVSSSSAENYGGNANAPTASGSPEPQINEGTKPPVKMPSPSIDKTEVSTGGTVSDQNSLNERSGNGNLTVPILPSSPPGDAGNPAKTDSRAGREPPSKSDTTKNRDAPPAEKTARTVRQTPTAERTVREPVRTAPPPPPAERSQHRRDILTDN